MGPLRTGQSTGLGSGLEQLHQVEPPSWRPGDPCLSLWMARLRSCPQPWEARVGRSPGPWSPYSEVTEAPRSPQCGTQEEHLAASELAVLCPAAERGRWSGRGCVRGRCKDRRLRVSPRQGAGVLCTPPTSARQLQPLLPASPGPFSEGQIPHKCPSLFLLWP